MKEKEIIQKVIDLIGNIDDVTIISAFNYSEERTPNMVVVGIDKVEQMNVGLPDYRYSLNITVDTFIEDDPDGALFHDILANVKMKIYRYINGEASLTEAFQEIPIVGWINSVTDISITNESNRAVLTSELIASF